MMAPNLLELKKHFDNALRHMVYFLGSPVWSTELDSIIFVSPLQLGLFYDSKIDANNCLCVTGMIFMACKTVGGLATPV